MEECTSQNTKSKKRVRDDSDELGFNSTESKRVAASNDSELNPPESERVDTEIKHDSPESNKSKHDSEDNLTDSDGNDKQLDSPEVMKFREDILGILDEPEMVPEIQDLESVIRSFEEEIIQTSPSQTHPTVSEFNSDTTQTQPDLGYLLEASDDELGLPPSVSDAQAQNQPINMVGFEDELPSYDSYEFGFGERVTDGNNNYGANGNGDFVTVDGLFDYADGSDFSDFSWRPESLPAL